MKMDLMKKKKKNGFTLIELIIVIAIIGILAAIAIPKFSDATDSSKRKTDIANARIIAHAVTLLAADGMSDADIMKDTTEGSKTITYGNISAKIQGGLPKPKAKTATGSAGALVEPAANFVILVVKGEATITNNNVQVYPTPEGVYQ